MAQRKIIILDDTYVLPEVATQRFQALQTDIQVQQQIIKTGQRPRAMGLFSRKLTPEERWRELDILTRNYDGIIEELTSSQGVYKDFFAKLAAGVQKALIHRSDNIQQLEEERLTDASKLEALEDETLRQAAQEDGERLLQAALLLGKGSLLILKKIKLCEEGLDHLVKDQELQRKLLSDLTNRLDGHRRAYERRRKIVAALEDAARVAEVALHFEDVLREHLGPLQGLLDHVAKIDGGLHDSVAEIENLTRQLLQQQQLTPLPGSDAIDERWMSFLTTGALKKERLMDIWMRMERQDGQMEALDVETAATNYTNTQSPVLTALTNIRTLVNERLSPVIAFSAPAIDTAETEPRDKLSIKQTSRAGPPFACRMTEGGRIKATFGFVVPIWLLHDGDVEPRGIAGWGLFGISYWVVHAANGLLSFLNPNYTSVFPIRVRAEK